MINLYRYYKGILYTSNDLIELLKLKSKNINPSNIIDINIIRYSSLAFNHNESQYEFTISVKWTKNTCLYNDIHIYEEDLLLYKRNRIITKIIN